MAKPIQYCKVKKNNNNKKFKKNEKRNRKKIKIKKTVNVCICITEFTFDVHLKLTQHCKSPIIQYKLKTKKKIEINIFVNL